MPQPIETTAKDGPPGAWQLCLKPRSAGRNLAVVDALTRFGADTGGRVTALLYAGYQAPEGDLAGFEDMAIIDRQAAVLRLALDHGSWPAWFVMTCASCGDKLDLRVAPDEFVLGDRAAPPPLRVPYRGGLLRFRRPAAREEARLQQGIAPLQLMDLLAIDPLPPEPERAALLEDFAAALEGDLARVSLSVPFRCPACGAGNDFWFDPYDWMARHAGGSLREVHRLALRYGWSEADILAMPEARRQAYLAFGEAP